MFPSTLNRNLHKPTSGSKLRKSVTWDDLPPATTRQQTTPMISPFASAPALAPPVSPTPRQRQHHPAKPSEPASPQEADTEDQTDDTPTTTPVGSRSYIHPGWSLLRAEQIRKNILALEGQHARVEGRRDSGFVDVSQGSREDDGSGQMQVEYPELPDGNEEMEEMSRGVGYIDKGKGKERATEEGESSQMEGMRVEYPSLPGVED